MRLPNKNPDRSEATGVGGGSPPHTQQRENPQGAKKLAWPREAIGAIPVVAKVCICQVGDSVVRKAAKRLNIPLSYARQIKRMHRKFKIHE